MASLGTQHTGPTVATTVMDPAPQLPKVLITRILQHLPIQQRLYSCALVCKAWAVAAVAATNTISFSFSTHSISKKKRIATWLQHYGQDVSGLRLTVTKDVNYSDRPGGCSWELSADPDGTFKLPCPQLHHLTSLFLDGMVLPSNRPLPQAQQQQQLGAAVAGSAALLPQLVELQLAECVVTVTADLQQLVCATGLTKLQAHDLRNATEWNALRPGDNIVTMSAVGSVMQHCSSLVSLKLSNSHGEQLDSDGPSPLASLSSLARLQDLDTDVPFKAPTAFLPAFPLGITSLALSAGNTDAVQAALQNKDLLQHLRSLRLHGVGLQGFGLQGGGLDADELGSLTMVTKLELWDTRFDAEGLGQMTQLQQLVLHECILAAPFPQIRMLGQVINPAGRTVAPRTAAQDAELILSVIGQLTNLQVLEVESWRREDIQEHFALGLQFDPVVLRDAAPSAFSALTASSRLERLHLDGEQYSSVHRGAVSNMFPAGRQLQHLTALLLSPERLQFQPRSHVLTADDLQSIASCCPSLRTLHIEGLLEPGASASALLQLTECRSLSVGGRAFNNPAAGVVAQMTQLTSLTWWCSQGFDSVGSSQLTALTNLQRLVVQPVCQPQYEGLRHDEAERVGTDVWGVLGGSRKVLRCEGATATPVWRQLDELCDRSPLLAPQRLQQLRADMRLLQMAHQDTTRQMQAGLQQQQDTVHRLQVENARLMQGVRDARGQLDRVLSQS